jgi:hypothetical protein
MLLVWLIVRNNFRPYANTNNLENLNIKEILFMNIKNKNKNDRWPP